MHLAAMLNAPVTALFGPSDPVINRPWGSNHLVMYKQIECNPCRKRKCKKLKCQTELKPEFVFNSIIKYLKLENGKIKWVK
jgi:ADP-heptose:LPS heptosyltransferase